MNALAKSKSLPFHIKGSKVYYQMCKGTKLIFEEVINPGKLNDSDFINKSMFMNRLKKIARQTMREELVGVIDKYFSRGTIAYIISDLDHNIIGLSISEASFENGNQILLPWLNIYLEEYREKGVYIICVSKSINHFISEYQKNHNLKGPKKIIPLFKEWVFISRTFNPRIYCSMLRSNMKVSPVIEKNGKMKKRKISKSEKETRITFLKKLGYNENEITNDSLFIIKAFSNENENKEMHENLPLSSVESVNNFFKNHLGLDQGNLLVSTAAFRPAILVTFDKIKKMLRKPRYFMKNIGSTFNSPKKESIINT